MKRFLFRTLLFFALACIADICGGFIFSFLRNNARGGQTYKNEYLAKQCEDDILILGSSKASHHYVPGVFEDTLGVKCYNAGEMGCGIIPAYVRYRMVCMRHKPKLILYEVTPGFDYYQDNLYSRYLGTIRTYTYNSEVRDVYLDFSDNLEKFRLMSSLYRNNSCLLKFLKDIIRPGKIMKGYEPLYGKYNPDKEKEVTMQHGNKLIIDSLKYHYVEKLILDTKHDDVKLVFIVSPKYENNEDMVLYEPVMALCKKYNVPLINNIDCDSFVGNKELFQDKGHLNDEGANEYSRIVVGQIKDYLQ